MYYDFPDEIQRFVDGWAVIDGEEGVHRIVVDMCKIAFRDGYWSGHSNPLAHEFYNRLVRSSVRVPDYVVQFVGKTAKDDERHYFAFNDTIYNWLLALFPSDVVRDLMDGKRVPGTSRWVCVCVHKQGEPNGK
jgi:hypothetical protein